MTTSKTPDRAIELLMQAWDRYGCGIAHRLRSLDIKEEHIAAELIQSVLLYARAHAAGRVSNDHDALILLLRAERVIGDRYRDDRFLRTCTRDEANNLITEAWDAHHDAIVRFMSRRTGDREAAQELVTDVFLDLRELIERGKITDRTLIVKHLYTHAKFVLGKWFAARKRRGQHHPTLPFPEWDADGDRWMGLEDLNMFSNPLSYLCRAETIQAVQAALATLPAAERTLIYKFCGIGGYTPERISPRVRRRAGLTECDGIAAKLRPLLAAA